MNFTAYVNYTDKVEVDGKTVTVISGRNAIISVSAADLKGAVAEVTRQLDRRGRRHYFERWQQDGCQIQANPLK